MLKIEYQVRPVVRYIVTRWFCNSEADEGLASGGVSTIGEFEGPWHANSVCKAMAASEEGATYIQVADTTVPELPAVRAAGEVAHEDSILATDAKAALADYEANGGVTLDALKAEMTGLGFGPNDAALLAEIKAKEVGLLTD